MDAQQQPSCPKCGSNNLKLQREGRTLGKTMVLQFYRCQCGMYFTHLLRTNEGQNLQPKRSTA